MEEVFLTPCPVCSRHILTDEPSCPFCNADVHDLLKSAKAPAPIPGRRMGRAAAFLFRATAVAGLTASTTSACAVEGDPAAQQNEVQPTPDAGHRTVNDAARGDEADPNRPDVHTADVVTPRDVWGAADAYGVAPAPDTGPDVDTADVVTADVPRDVWGAADAYGVAPDATDATGED